MSCSELQCVEIDDLTPREAVAPTREDVACTETVREGGQVHINILMKLHRLRDLDVTN
jgi:hypothetical protein